MRAKAFEPHLIESFKPAIEARLFFRLWSSGTSNFAKCRDDITMTPEQLEDMMDRGYVSRLTGQRLLEKRRETWDLFVSMVERAKGQKFVF